MRTFQKRRVVHYENQLPYKVAEAYQTQTGIKVIVAADRPELFEGSEAFRMARRTARRSGYLKFETSGPTEVYGTQALAMKAYYFKR